MIGLFKSQFISCLKNQNKTSFDFRYDLIQILSMIKLFVNKSIQGFNKNQINYRYYKQIDWNNWLNICYKLKYNSNQTLKWVLIGVSPKIAIKQMRSRQHSSLKLDQAQSDSIKNDLKTLYAKILPS